MKPPLARKDRVPQGKGKQPKHFLETKEVLELALSIADVQEIKSRGKTERHHQPQPGYSGQSDRKTPKAKDRVKEKKAILLAQRLKSKKEKAKAKQRDAQAPGDKPPASNPKSASAPVGKKVSFA